MSAVAKSRAAHRAEKPVERYSMPAPQTMLAPNPATTVPLVPMPGETQSQFFDRANRVLQGTCPEQIQRTAAILRIWQQSPNDANLRKKAHARFTSDEFTHQGPRCIFLSHTIPEIAEERDVTTNEVTRPGREGTVYNRENLQHLVDYANYRILNAGQFAALSEGHMPTKAEKDTGRPDAETLGWAGPFYLGLFGDVNPQWSIWADEWIHNEDLPRAKKLQRRSPEVWCKEPIEARTMDPIAMLGSETPRLDSGMDIYSLRSDGQMVMRYSMGMATALPSATNAFVPGGSHKQNYGASDMAFLPGDDKPKPTAAAPNAGGAAPPQKPAAPAPGGPPAPGGGVDVAGIVQSAISELMPSIVQAVTDFMQASNPTSQDAVPQEGQDDPSDDAIPRGIDAPPEEDAGGEIDPAANATPPGQTPPDANADPMATQPPGGGDAANPMAPPQAVTDQMGAPGGDPLPDDDADSHAKYASMSPECGEAYAAGHAACQRKMTPKGPEMTAQAPAAPQTTNYSKLAADQAGQDVTIKTQAAQIDALQKQVAHLLQDKQDTERYSKISKIIATKELPEEMTPETILADAFEMAEPEFDRYCKMLSLVPTKADVVETVFYDDPHALTENYSRAGGGAMRHTPDDIQRYSRMAADMVVKINNTKGATPTTYAEQWEKVAKANNIPV